MCIISDRNNEHYIIDWQIWTLFLLRLMEMLNNGKRNYMKRSGKRSVIYPYWDSMPQDTWWKSNNLSLIMGSTTCWKCCYLYCLPFLHYVPGLDQKACCGNNLVLVYWQCWQQKKEKVLTQNVQHFAFWREQKVKKLTERMLCEDD